MPAVGFAIEPIATCETLERVYAFDEHSYDIAAGRACANIPLALFKEWWIACPTGFLCAFGGDEPQAVIGLFPVSDAWARDFLAYRKSERELRAGDIAASNRRTWYFSGLSSRRPDGLASASVHSRPCALEVVADQPNAIGAIRSPSWRARRRRKSLRGGSLEARSRLVRGGRSRASTTIDIAALTPAIRSVFFAPG